MLCREVTVVMNMMRTLVTIGASAFYLRMVVESDGKQHWHIDQHQQPGKPRSSVIETTHYPNNSFFCVQK